MPLPTLRARQEIDADRRTFASGLLLDLVSAIRQTASGELIAVTSAEPETIASDLDAWSRFTGHAVVAKTTEHGRTRWVIRHGAAEDRSAEERPIGERLWLYLNFDCNLQCDYCCVRSSPSARRRALGIETVLRIASEAPPLGVRTFFVTGGEPFLLPDVDRLVLPLSDAAPVVLLTNGMLFRGSRLDALRRLPRDRVTLQISVDSATVDLHDAHRGRGSWQRAVDGIQIAKAEGFRVRIASTVATDVDEREYHAFLNRLVIPPDDRLVRRVALRGFATTGLALGRADLVPEATITADGMYWHPVGAEDDDLLVTRDIFPLARAFDAIRRAFEDERAHHTRLASVFRCA